MLSSIYSFWTQILPGSPTYTESNIPPQDGRVFIVTGGNSGIGFELVKLLYAKNGTIYMACRSEEKASAAIKSIQDATPEGKGTVRFLHLDLNDLSSVAASTAEFARQESRLDVLWNNAGLFNVPPGSRTVQGIEAHIGINCVAHLLLSQLLLPQMRAAAKSGSPASTRVVWTSSCTIEMLAPKGGLNMADLDNPPADPPFLYACSKAGNWLLAAEFARRFGEKEGIVSVTQNPGNLTTKMWYSVPFIRSVFRWFLYGANLGAYTEAWAGLSEEVRLEDGGRYAVPWGRWLADPREDILASIRGKDAGGTGLAADFWDWCEEKIRPYMNT